LAQQLMRKPYKDTELTASYSYAKPQTYGAVLGHANVAVVDVVAGALMTRMLSVADASTADATTADAVPAAHAVQ
jgi:hypothetical protein